MSGEYVNKQEASVLAWRADLIDILAGRDGLSRSAYHLAGSEKLKQFLSDERSTYQIVSGARGMGKTTILYYKAAALSSSKSRKHLLVQPDHPFIYRLPPGGIIIPPERRDLYSSHSAWLALWQLVLGSVMAFAIVRDTVQIPWTATAEWLRRFGIREASREAEFITIVLATARNTQHEGLTRIINWVIESGIEPRQQTLWTQAFVRPLMSELAQNIACAIFVDGIDEAIGGDAARAAVAERESLDAPHPLSTPDALEVRHSENVKLLGEETWIAAQTGYAHAAHLLRTATSHAIRILGSMRPEATARFAINSNLTDGKVTDQLILPLEYSLDELRDVFKANVAVTPDSGLVNPKATDEATRFFGSSTVLNRVVWKEEELFIDALIRHTFYRPRDVVMVGKHLCDYVAPARRLKYAEAMSSINEAAKKTLAEHLSYVYPPWDASLVHAYPLLHKNILSTAEMVQVEEQFRHLRPEFGGSFLRYLFEKQLIGIPVEKAGTDKFVIRFLRLSRSEEGSTLQWSSNVQFCVLHPALAAAVYDKLSHDQRRNFYQHYFVVGEGREVRWLSVQPVIVQICVPDGERVAQVYIHEKKVPTADGEQLAALLLRATLCAIRGEEQSKVTVSEIVNEAAALIANRHSLEPRIRGEAEPIEQYLRKQLTYKNKRRGEPYCVRTLNEDLEKSGFRLRLNHSADGMFWFESADGSALESASICIRLREAERRRAIVHAG